MAKHHSSEDVERGLLALAHCAGSPTKAAEMLATDGHRIATSTLQHWRDHTHADRYQHIEADVIPKIHAQIAGQFEHLIQRANEAELASIERYIVEVGDLPPKELSTAIRNLATSSGIHSDKLPLLRRQPTAIVEHRAPDEILKRLAERYGGAIDSTAEELPDGG